MIVLYDYQLKHILVIVLIIVFYDVVNAAGVTIDTEKLSKNKDCNNNGKLCFGNVTYDTVYYII